MTSEATKAAEAFTTQQGSDAEAGRPAAEQAGQVAEEQEAGAGAGPSEEPLKVEIICGVLRGTLLVDKLKVVSGGQEMSPTEFEKLGGKALAKKWRTSCKVVAADGSTRQQVGDWLQERNCQAPIPRGGNRPGGSISQLRRAMAPRPPKDTSERQFCTASDIQAHLRRQFLGLLPGDPTADDLPAELPPSSPSPSAPAQPDEPRPLVVVDLALTTHAQLMALSASSAQAPLGALLPKQPGVARDRMAYVTGQKPAVERGSVPVKGSAQAAAALEDYLCGRSHDCPWLSLGARGPIMIAGKELDLRRLHELVKERGGYHQVCTDKKWSATATLLGITADACTNRAHLLRKNYQRFLGAYITRKPSLPGEDGDEEASSEEAAAVSGSLDAGEMAGPADSFDLCTDPMASVPDPKPDAHWKGTPNRESSKDGGKPPAPPSGAVPPKKEQEKATSKKDGPELDSVPTESLLAEIQRRVDCLSKPEKRLILVGPPGCGKGTQSPQLKKEHCLCHLATGDMLRAAVAAGTPMGKEAEKAMQSGGLVADDIVVGLIEEASQRPECRIGFILDGFPRTLTQAEKLDDMLTKRGGGIDAVLDFSVPESILVERVTGRLVHPASGRSYHEKFHPPKKEGVDDFTGEPLIRRKDDTEEILKSRLKTFRDQTAPVLEHYKSKVAHIQAEKSKEDVAAQISKAL
ncbi:hypothetical protein WJX73_000611 [Symbiochloris irregularis]|uniref:adenylate kinase n=1 Tax=Symbiochloris irregularis TaxID=706552 RepID=A0AAW1P6J8_9CHLO